MNYLFIQASFFYDLWFLGEHCVPKGAAVGINIFAIHRNPEYYENPSIFDPENFSEEKITSRHPFAFIPFGAGIRKCIGK